MTQIPWFDKLWYKGPLTTILKQQVAVPILKIVSEATNERQQKIKDDIGIETNKSIGDRDFLSRFLEIQNTNSSIPPW